MCVQSLTVHTLYLTYCTLLRGYIFSELTGISEETDFIPAGKQSILTLDLCHFKDPNHYNVYISCLTWATLTCVCPRMFLIPSSAVSGDVSAFSKNTNSKRPDVLDFGVSKMHLPVTF